MAKTNELLLWERILPSTDNEDVADALRCEIHDPLWLLARQWQLGEFQAEDAGMLASSHLAVQVTSPASYSNSREKSFPFSKEMALDTVMESRLPPFDLNRRIDSARKWRNMLIKAGKPDIWDQFCQMPLLQFKMPELEFDPDNQAIGMLYHEPFEQTLAALSNGRMMDGGKLFQELQTRKASDFLNQSNSEIDDLGEKWKKWVNDRLQVNNPGFVSSWEEANLEYRGKVSLPIHETGSVVLEVPEYNGQKLAWFHWNEKTGNSGTTSSLHQIAPKNLNFNHIPTNVNFPGMPRARWWEMEDSTIDMSNITAQNTDTGLLLLAEFSLLYSNDWLLVPLSLPMGSLSKIQSLTVRDVFGVKANIPTNRTRKDWRMFQLSPHQLADWLWLPPVSTGQVQGEVLEEVKFIRDEMANMVWAVEQKVENGLGGSLEGASTAKGLEAWLRTLSNTPVPPPLPDQPISADYSYQVGNTVPPHWIPFIPVRTNENSVDMILRRAAMPRIFEGIDHATRIRPRTSLVRNSGPNGQTQKLDIREEEIPANGITLKTYWKRARWLDGKVLTWLTHEKSPGITTESSGLQFDFLKNSSSIE